MVPTCEIANQEKTTQTGLKQKEEIEFLKQNHLFDLLEENTKTVLEYRYKYPESVMIHQPLGGIQGQATDIKIVSEHILKTKQKLITIMSDKTKQSKRKLEKDMEIDL